MSDNKWIDGLEPDMPTHRAAGNVLEVRLGAVVHHLPLALAQADNDPEHVHQLRVSTRRAAAALRIFKDCLPGKVHKQVRKYLRRIRKSAGEARDADVFLMTLTARLPRARPNERAGLDFLFGFGRHRRMAAQEHLRDANAEDAGAGVAIVASALEALSAPSSAPATLAELAHPMLARLVGELERAAAQDLHAYDQLHQVRILGKQLRYAMEVFGCCFGAGFRERIYPAVEQMQDILGDANDSHVAAQHLQTLRTHLQMTQPKQWQRWQHGVDGLLGYHERRLPRQRRLFLEWWRDWQGSRDEMDLHGMLAKD
jgi:CHAD domain-containing protein